MTKEFEKNTYRLQTKHLSEPDYYTDYNFLNYNLCRLLTT